MDFTYLCVTQGSVALLLSVHGGIENGNENKSKRLVTVNLYEFESGK